MRMSGLKLGLLSASISLAFPCLAAGSTYAAPDAPAQEAAQQGQDADQSGRAVTLNVVTVNADGSKGFKTKYVQVGAFRDQSVLDTPSTVNVFTRDLMDTQNVDGVFDVLKNSAGVTRSQTNGQFADNLTIRGLAVQNRSNFRLNGSLPVNNLMSMPMENKERVEVLKGTSALYYGFTSPGGVINMVTKRANKTPNLSVQANWNEYGQMVGSVDAGTRFGAEQQFGVRVNAAAGDTGDFGIDHVEGDRSFYSLAADWKVNQRLSLYFDYEKAKRSVNEQAIIQVPAAVAGVITLPRRPEYSNYLSAGPWAVTKGNVENVIGKAVIGITDTWMGSIEVGRATTNRTDRGLGIFRITNMATGDGSLSMSMNQGERYVNDNIRAEVTGLIPMGSITNEVSFGVMRNKRFQNSARGDSRNVYKQNMYNPVQFDRLYPFVRPAVGYLPQNAQDDGIYLFDRIRFNDQWQVVLGARRTDYENISAKTPTTNTVYKAKKTSPSASVVYQFRSDTSLYASYIEGLEEGETAPVLGSVVNPGEVFGPKISKQKELGLKTEALAGVTATIAYFEMKVPTPGYLVPTTTPGMNRFVQEGMSRYRGFEFTVTGEITPELSIAAGGMLMNAKQTSAANPALVGKIPDSTPERTLNAYLDYQPTWAPGFGFSAGSFYVGKRPLGPQEQGFIPSYTTYSVGARYVAKFAGERKLTFQLNVDNATDKAYWAGGNNYLAVGAPRTISLLTRLDWF